MKIVKMNWFLIVSMARSWKEKWLRCEVADYVIFLITLHDILFWWWLYTANCDQNLCWTCSATSGKNSMKIHHWKDGCCKWKIYQDIKLSSKMSIHFAEKLNTILMVTHVTYTAFHFPACSSPSFQALLEISIKFCACVHWSSQSRQLFNNNNYQKNYYIGVMCEVSNYLRISLLWQGDILFVMKFYLYQMLVGDWLLHRKRRLEEKGPLNKLQRFDN